MQPVSFRREDNNHRYTCTPVPCTLKYGNPNRATVRNAAYILFRQDGSECATTGRTCAAHLARASGGSIILVRVVSTATEFWPYQNSTPQPTLVRTVTVADLTEEYLSALTKEPDPWACLRPIGLALREKALF